MPALRVHQIKPDAYILKNAPRQYFACFSLMIDRGCCGSGRTRDRTWPARNAVRSVARARPMFVNGAIPRTFSTAHPIASSARLASRHDHLPFGDRAWSLWTTDPRESGVEPLPRLRAVAF
jgi:hypothetical protein